LIPNVWRTQVLKQLSILIDPFRTSDGEQAALNIVLSDESIMKNFPLLFKNTFLSIAYIILLLLYINNDFNRHLLGIISDSFWLTVVSTLFIIFLLQKTDLKFSKVYFQIRKLEYSSKLYRVIGVTFFKKILQRFYLPKVTLKISLRDRSKSEISHIENQMEQAEQIHVLGFILIVIVSIIFSILRDVSFILWFTIFNILMNLYPVLLQRYNRNRIRIIIENYHLKNKSPNKRINQRIS
jgi:hypothetical protein